MGPPVRLFYLLLPLALAIVAGCKHAESGPLSSAGRAAKGSTELVVARGDFEKRLLLTGEVDVVSALEIKVPRLPAPKVAVRWLEEDGAVVKAGQKVAELDGTSLANQVRDKSILVAQAEADGQRQRWELALQESDKALDVERKRAVLKRAELDADIPPNILPKRDFLEKQLALRRARTDLDRADDALSAFRRTMQMEIDLKRLSLEKIQREVRWVEKQIETLTIRAPADGVLLIGDHPEGRKFQIGDDVLMGTSIARMPTQALKRVRAYLSDVDDGRVEVGMAAVVMLDAYPEQRFPGRVREVSPVASEVSERSQRRIFKVAVELDDSEANVLRPGLSARVEVAAASLRGKLLVPRPAIDFATLPYRTHLGDGNAVEVTLGGCNAEVCVAVAGPLQEGTRLRRASP